MVTVRNSLRRLFNWLRYGRLRRFNANPHMRGWMD
jgi:hypothetical protein